MITFCCRDFVNALIQRDIIQTHREKDEYYLEHSNALLAYCPYCGVKLPFKAIAVKVVERKAN